MTPIDQIRKALDVVPANDPRIGLMLTRESVAALLASHDAAVQRAAEMQADALAEFDKAISEELPRVSHVEYDSHEICKHFASKVRERIAAIRAIKE